MQKGNYWCEDKHCGKYDGKTNNCNRKAQHLKEHKE